MKMCMEKFDPNSMVKMCKKCKGANLVKKGFTKSGMQRYQCMDCKVTQSKPVWGITQQANLGKVDALLFTGATVEEVAAQVGIGTTVVYERKKKLLATICIELEDHMLKKHQHKKPTTAAEVLADMEAKKKKEKKDVLNPIHEWRTTQVKGGSHRFVPHMTVKELSQLKMFAQIAYDSGFNPAMVVEYIIENWFDAAPYVEAHTTWKIALTPHLGSLLMHKNSFLEWYRNTTEAAKKAAKEAAAAMAAEVEKEEAAQKALAMKKFAAAQQLIVDVGSVVQDLFLVMSRFDRQMEAPKPKDLKGWVADQQGLVELMTGYFDILKEAKHPKTKEYGPAILARMNILKAQMSK